MGMRWFRVYAALLHNPKFQRLSDSLRSRLLNLWCLAAERDGALPGIADIAFALRISHQEAQKTVDKLKTSGFLEQTERGLMPHDWNEHQCVSDISTGRVKRHRERMKRNAPVSETVNGRFGNGDETVNGRFGNGDETVQSREEKRRVEESGRPLSISEWLEWEAFQVYVACGSDDRTGKIGSAVMEALNQRCPGFLEDEAGNVLRCRMEKRPYSFITEFLPRLTAWILGKVLDGRSIPFGESTADPRFARMQGFLALLDRRGNWHVDEYPTFDEWKAEAWADREATI